MTPPSFSQWAAFAFNDESWFSVEKLYRRKGAHDARFDSSP